MVGRDMRGELEASQPPTETDEICHLSILEFEHGVLNILLGCIELLAEPLPVTTITQLEETLASGGEALAGAECIRLADKRPADIDEHLPLAGNGSDKTICHEGTELQ